MMTHKVALKSPVQALIHRIDAKNLTNILGLIFLVKCMQLSRLNDLNIIHVGLQHFWNGD